MARQNKYRYTFVVQGNYGYGWDDLTESDTVAEARKDLRDYRANEFGGASHRIVKRRKINR